VTDHAIHCPAYMVNLPLVHCINMAFAFSQCDLFSGLTYFENSSGAVCAV